MTERLQKILSARGIASRRAAEVMIESGRVSVNGIRAQLGQVADPQVDTILVDGKPIPSENPTVYLMLHKPRGFVTTLSDEKGRRTASQLVADCGYRVYPVGRLDMDSEGLLLFTNDGEFANTMMHPKHEVNKTYHAWVVHFNDEALHEIKQPITLDGYRIRKPDVRLMGAKEDKALLEITIHEGRNRQVRRMCEAAGMHVTRLKRVGEGNLRLGELPLGKWRYLTEEEIRLLKAGK
jgi:23S rRNA pseudouridine2605 synthase